WEQIMMNTDEHFGQFLSLTDIEKRTMMRYLLDNSAGHVNDEISNRILESLKYNPVPIRITETPYWKYKHNKIKGKLIKQNANKCNQCHQDAFKGKYDIDREQHSSYSQKHASQYDLKM
ncbi:MAG: diheme cytochrome c, partial [gamma proteobacterium symbiont of Lucinoma myriamae]|nr:diheme cytochrome c [gamma proteobacterium symbiont of Lucinoma myriamae]